MKPLTALTSAAVLLGALSSDVAYAEKKAWRLSLEGGVEFDDNLAVDENDLHAGKGDAAATFQLGAGYKLLDTDQSRVEIGYDFYQSVYADLSEFNYQEHSPTLSVSTKVDGIKFGFTYSYLHSLLDNRFFLDQHALSP